ncbi:DUF819 family protein [Halosquirtibacter xylanolyticus]|uniref:DUF819 family protein n=1 Tax=Halosquirtibacter xylanolyticus TaxID=3374599 RepID=UPI0037495B1B|nr:DUF819 family protein [Prolixibacteraceae bacterium]
MTSIFIILYLIVIPIMIAFLQRRSKTIRKIGAIPLLYLLGIGLHQIVPFDQWISPTKLYDIEETFSSVMLLLAIPLLLFSINIKQEIKKNKHIVSSITIALVSLIFATVTAFFIFKNRIPEAYNISGMLTGLYSGGSPNLAAIKNALQVSPQKLVLIVSYDFAIGVGVILFFITIAKHLFRRFLPHNRITESHHNSSLQIEDETNIFDQHKWKGMAKGLLISFIIVAASVLLGKYFSETAGPIITILTATTLAILLGQIPAINRLKGTFSLGLMFILIFSFTIANMADFSSIQEIKNPALFLMMLWVMACNLITHFTLAYLFKKDADKTMVSIIAFTYSPVMVPVVCAAIKNRSVLVYGITFGLLGYLVGNYLGILLATLLHQLM